MAADDANTQPVFVDDPPQTVNVTSYPYHEEPGNLLIESWGMLVKSEDYNANTKDLEAENNRYEYVRKTRERLETMHTHENDEKFHVGHVDEEHEDTMITLTKFWLRCSIIMPPKSAFL